MMRWALARRIDPLKAATVVVLAIALAASYSHQVKLILMLGGEARWLAYVLPISVDVLLLVSLSGVRTARTRLAVWANVAGLALALAVSIAANVISVQPTMAAEWRVGLSVAVAAWAPTCLAVIELIRVSSRHAGSTDVSEGAISDVAPPVSPSEPIVPGAGTPSTLAPAPGTPPEPEPEPVRLRAVPAEAPRPAVRVVAPAGSRRDEIRAWRDANPDATYAEIADQFGVSTKTVQRALADPEPALNGHHQGDN